MGDTASGRTKGLLLRPSTKEAWTNLSTSWVLGLDPSNTDKFSPRYAQAFTNLFVYLSYLVTAKFQDVPNNSKRSLTIRYVFYYFVFFIYFYFYLPQILACSPLRRNGSRFLLGKVTNFPLIRGQLQQNSMTERVNLLLFEEKSAPHDTEYSH